MKIYQLALILLGLLAVDAVAGVPQSAGRFLPHKRTPTSPRSATETSQAPANPTICGNIIDDANNGSWYQWASDAYDCLRSVPFHAAVAHRFIDYFNTTIQFQSSLAYLRNPPQGYQQPSIDVDRALQDIAANASAGHYQNQYEFEADVMRLIYGMHDTHVSLYAGAMAAFTFGSGVSLVSASLDGVQPPKVYLLYDVIQRRDHGYNISAISEISGENAIDWLKGFAAKNSIGTVEPHADWNQVMYSPVLDILQSYDIFNEGVTFYPGDDLSIDFENGTDSLSGNWLAVYTGTTYTGPLTTGGDFYNFYVLGNSPANYEDLNVPEPFRFNDDDFYSAIEPLPNWYDSTNGSYPRDPIVVQDNLTTGVIGGVVTGYMLDDIRTGVLSIPSFDEAGYDIGTFATAVNSFIGEAQSNKAERIIIDLQGNLGGQPLLAFSTFGSFFPNIMPFAGSRRRSHRLADLVGDATTTYWANLPPRNENKTFLVGDEWVVTNRINAETHRNFSSWSQYYGPKAENGDYFSLVEQYDFSNINFQVAVFDEWYTSQFQSGANKSATPPFDAKQIVILTDGQCASTCTLFLEMMTHQAGVRTIAVGGLPETGPMQTGSGTRGAASYSDDQLNDDFASANSYSDGETTSQLPPLIPGTDSRDSGMFVNYLGFNLRDQVRAANKTYSAVPLQFAYLAADCRIYFTLDNVLNMTQLWRDAATATWLDSSRCVANSTGYSLASSNGEALAPPDRTESDFTFLRAPGSASEPIASSESDADAGNGVWDSASPIPRSVVRPCDDKEDRCDPGFYCIKTRYSCDKNSEVQTQSICVPACTSTEKKCLFHHMTCDLSHPISAEARSLAMGLSSRRLGKNSKHKQLGRCMPDYGVNFQGLGCKKAEGAPVDDDDSIGS